MSEERGFKTYCSPDVLFVMNSCLFFEIWESVLQSNYIFHVPEQAMCGWRCATPTNDLNTEAQMYALRGTVNVAVSPVSLACGCIKYGWRIWGLVSLQACSPPTCNTCLLAYLMLLDAVGSNFSIQAIAPDIAQGSVSCSVLGRVVEQST